jgi:hypothetical protein
MNYGEESESHISRKIKYEPFELHTHTVNSDGKLKPQELLNNAKKAGLSGIALTDHNTTAGHYDAQKIGDELGILVIPGIEWTTFYGHLTVLGGDPPNWRDVRQDNIREKAKLALESGSCIGMAHPCRPGYPVCTGGSDDFGLSPDQYDVFTHYEVWSYLNPAVKKSNMIAEKRYEAICEANIRLSCVYGRDWHQGDNNAIYAVTFLGIDGNFTVDNALNAIRNKRTYISTGLKADFVLENNLKTKFQIGEQVAYGEYVFYGKISYFNDAYTHLNKVRYKRITLKGANSEYSTEIGETGTFKISFNNSTDAYLQPTVYGEIMGVSTKLLLATPYFFVLK